MCLLQLPSGTLCAGTRGASCAGGGSQPAAAAALCCLTCAEDGVLRQQLLRPAGRHAGPAASPGGAFDCTALLAEQAQGAPIKALALLPLPPPRGAAGDGGGRAQQEGEMVSAGAQQALMAFHLRRPPPAGAGGPAHVARPLQCDQLAVRQPELARRAKVTAGA